MFKRKNSQDSKPLSINEPTDYPSGSVVASDTGTFLIKGKQKYKFPSERVLSSWRYTNILPGSQASLSPYLMVGTYGFRDGTLIKSIADGKMYLISDNRRRHITSPDVFTRLGLTRDNCIEASDEEVLLHKEGDALNG